MLLPVSVTAITTTVVARCLHGRTKSARALLPFSARTVVPLSVTVTVLSFLPGGTWMWILVPVAYLGRWGRWAPAPATRYWATAALPEE